MAKVRVNIVNKSNNPLPKYETELSAGMDVRADFSNITVDTPIKVYGDSEMIFKGEGNKMNILRLAPGSRALIPTGLFVAIPEGYEIQVRPRSGLALKEGVSLVNCVGTIDSDYRNEVGVIVINHGLTSIYIEEGERICQFVLNKVDQIVWEPADSLNETDRKGGFGHTGKL